MKNKDGILKSEKFNKIASRAKTVMAFGAGVLAGAIIGGIVNAASYESDIEKFHNEIVPQYSEYVESKTEEYQSKVYAGEMTIEDYEQKVKELDDWKLYVENEGGEEQVEKLEKIENDGEKKMIASLSVMLASGAVALAASGVSQVAKKKSEKASIEELVAKMKKKNEQESENEEEGEKD